MVNRKPEISKQTKDSLQQTFASENVWRQEYSVGHTGTYYRSHDEMLSMLWFFLFGFYFWGEIARANGRYEGVRR